MQAAKFEVLDTVVWTGYEAARNDSPHLGFWPYAPDPTMHSMPVTGGHGFRGLKPLWYNSVPPYVDTREEGHMSGSTFVCSTFAALALLFRLGLYAWAGDVVYHGSLCNPAESRQIITSGPGGSLAIRSISM